MTWKLTLFSELAEFRNGLNFVKNDNGRNIKIIGVSDFKDYIELESLDTLEQITIKGDLKYEDLLQDDDLLFVRSNGNKKLIGRCMIIKVGNQEISYSGFTIRARLKSKEVLPRFLVQLFRSVYIKDQIQTVGGGTNISNLSQSILGDIKIPLPPLLEQCRIAEMLGVWDESIDLLERLIGKTRSRKQGLMQQLLTGKKRFKEFEGSEWRTVKLRDISTINYGKSPKNIFSDDGEFPVYGTGGITGYTSTYIYDGKSVIVGRKGTIDKVRYVDGKFWAIDTTYYLECKEIAQVKWIYYFLSSANLAELNEASGVPSLNRDTLYAIKFKIPSLPEQEKIAAVLSAADEEISTLEKQLAAYKQQKLGLMQQLLTGRIRI